MRAISRTKRSRSGVKPGAMPSLSSWSDRSGSMSAVLGGGVSFMPIVILSQSPAQKSDECDVGGSVTVWSQLLHRERPAAVGSGWSGREPGQILDADRALDARHLDDHLLEAAFRERLFFFLEHVPEPIQLPGTDQLAERGKQHGVLTCRVRFVHADEQAHRLHQLLPVGWAGEGGGGRQSRDLGGQLATGLMLREQRTDQIDQFSGFL